jgi:hypothetical protein
MDLITTMAGTILGWFVALAAHVVARDAYANAPRYAQRLIEAAIKSLPENDQARYCEEWLADLNERTGVLSKFQHAVECYICVRKVASTCRAKRACVAATSVTVSGDMSGEWSVEVDNATAAFLLTVLKGVKRGVFLKDVELHHAVQAIEQKIGRISWPKITAIGERLLKVTEGNSTFAIHPKVVADEKETAPDELDLATIDKLLGALGIGEKDAIQNKDSDAQ